MSIFSILDAYHFELTPKLGHRSGDTQLLGLAKSRLRLEFLISFVDIGLSVRIMYLNTHN